jgi:hypothetical protein
LPDWTLVVRQAALDPAALVQLVVELIQKWTAPASTAKMRTMPNLFAEQYCTEKKLDLNGAVFVTEMFYSFLRYKALTETIVDGLYGKGSSRFLPSPVADGFIILCDCCLSNCQGSTCTRPLFLS